MLLTSFNSNFLCNSLHEVRIVCLRGLLLFLRWAGLPISLCDVPSSLPIDPRSERTKLKLVQGLNMQIGMFCPHYSPPPPEPSLAKLNDRMLMGRCGIAAHSIERVFHYDQYIVCEQRKCVYLNNILILPRLLRLGIDG